MDVTPHELRTVELRESWRGYRQDDVDELLDRVAATIERLQGQVDRLTERVSSAEEEAGVGREADEMLRRTLLLAQRTADAAVSEAQERARRLVAEAEAKAQAAVTGAETEARRAAIAERQRLEGDIRDLAQTRESLRADVDNLERIADDHRRKLRELFEAELASIESRPAPTLERAPDLDPMILPPTTAPADTAAGAAADPGEPTRVMPAAEIEPEPAGEPQLVLPPEPEPEPLPEEPEPVPAPEAPAEVEREGEVVLGELDDDPASVETAGPPAPSPADLLPGGPAAAARFEPANLDDDSFFAELRAAVADEAPLGPRDEEEEAAWLEWATGESVLYDQDAPDAEGGKIRSVFRRRG